MQQTKRRSKKGVILLALTIALLVLAFVPAAMAAAPSLTVNNGATVIGNTDVTLQFNERLWIPGIVSTRSRTPTRR